MALLLSTRPGSLSFNRTIVELKLGGDKAKQLIVESFNRTIVELKFSKVMPKINIAQPFNRTIVELKFDNCNGT